MADEKLKLFHSQPCYCLGCRALRAEAAAAKPAKRPKPIGDGSLTGRFVEEGLRPAKAAAKRKAPVKRKSPR
jgi:hypothetical protein